MSKSANPILAKSAERLLAELACRMRAGAEGQGNADDVAALLSADLACRGSNGTLAVTAAGRSYLARHERRQDSAGLDPFRRQHLALNRREVDTAGGRAQVAVDDAESPLAWLARRKGRNGRPLIEPVQLQAGERLRAEFTRAQLMPRVTSNWNAAVADGPRGAGAATFTEAVLAARQRVRQALDAVGPEFSGLLLDVCCFLKRLEDVERERSWPPRSAKVVLQLGLDRLAGHYGWRAALKGPSRAPIQTWLAPDASFVVGE